MTLIPYGRQYIDKADILSVKKSLSLEKITTGNKVINFEKKISKFTKAKYSVVCSSGTSDLYLALKAIKIKKNDIVIMPAINFIAAYNVSKLNNAKIIPMIRDVNINDIKISILWIGAINQSSNEPICFILIKVEDELS